MYLLRSINLRSVIFACQKTADIFDYFTSDYSMDFLKTVFYGIAAFSLRVHAGTNKKWTGMDEYSEELGIRGYPLFRFCYDYIMTQRMDSTSIPGAAKCLGKIRLYDPRKTSTDSDIQTLLYFYIHTEVEVKNAALSVINRLKKIDDISFSDYGRIASAFVALKYALSIEIDEAKALLIENLKGRANDIQENNLFWSTMSSGNEEEKQEFIQLREDMIRSLHEGDGRVFGFDYLPEQASLLHEYTAKRTGLVYEAHGFAKYLDIPRLAKMFFRSTPDQMEEIREAFTSLYRQGGLLDRLVDDYPAIEQLLSILVKEKENVELDRVQQLQYRWFIENLSNIKNSVL